MQGPCNGTKKLTMHLSDMVAVCKEISCATEAQPTAEVCRTFFQELGVLVESEDDFNFSVHDKTWDLSPGFMGFSPTSLIVIFSVVLYVFVSIAPRAKFFLPRRAVKMSVEEPDMKKLEIAIFSNNANQSEEAFKILKDFISNEKPCTRQPYFLACRHELKKGSMVNINNYVRLSKIRCIGDKYVEFICQKFDPKSTLAEARKHLLHYFENPEKNITFDAEQTVVEHNLETIEQNQYTHRLQDACDNFNQNNCNKCLELFKEGLELAKRSKIQIDANTEQGIKFISAMAHVKIGKSSNLKNALDIYTSMIGIKLLREEKDIAEAGQADKMPMAMLGLALLLDKLFRFKLGLKVAERGLKIVADKGNSLTKYTWPGTQIEFEYGTLEYLKSEFERLKCRFTCPPKPTAVCRYANCLDHQPMPCRDIFVGEPDFAGYVTIGCEALCKVSYHYVCWKEYRETIPTNQSRSKITDKDILGTVCPTEDCYKFINEAKIPNKIIEYTVFGNDGEEKTYKKKENTPDPEVSTPAPPPPQPKKKHKKKPIPVAEPGTSTSKASAPSNASKTSPTKVNRGNTWVKQLGLPEPDENTTINNLVKHKLPMVREKNGILPTLIQVTPSVNPAATMEKPLWYLSVFDWVTNNQGAMRKEELFNTFNEDLRAITDYKKKYFKKEERKGAISKTEFFGHLLASDEFGCIDDWVCLVDQLQQASEGVANEFQDLYGKLFKVLFVPKDAPKSMPPAPMARVNQERRDSLRERRDSDRERRDSDRERRDSGRERKDSDREWRDSIRERHDSNGFNGKNGILKNSGDSPSRNSTPEPTKVQTKPEQLVPTVMLLDKEFKTSTDTPVFNPQSMPAKGEIKSEKRNSVERDRILVANGENMPQQSDSAVSIESEQNDEARRKIEELERKLSESNAKCLETQKQLEGFLGEAHSNTLVIESIRAEHKEKEKNLYDLIQSLTFDKAKEIKAKEELKKSHDDMKKELTELKKKVDGAEISKSKKKKQDEISGGAMQKVIHHIERHWEFIYQSYQKDKSEKEALVYELLEPLHDCTSEHTYTAVLQYIQDMETALNNLDEVGRHLKNRLGAVKDAPKNPELHWPTLSKIDLPKLPDMPSSVIMEAVKECVKNYADLLKRQAETPTAEPVEVPELAPSPSLPNFEQVPQNAAQRQEIQSSPVPSEPEEMGACALPPRSLLPPTLVNRKVPMMPFHAPPPFPAHHLENGMGSQAAPNFFYSPNPLFQNPPPPYGYVQPTAHHPPPQPAVQAPPQPAVQVPQRQPVAQQEPQRQPPPPQRPLLPSSVLAHVGHIARSSTRTPTMADNFKRPTAPSIHMAPAYRLPESELHITAYKGFAELEQELFMIGQLIRYAAEKDLRQALHWLCQRKPSAEVRELEPELLKMELCNILTEMLMSASPEEINEQDTELVKNGAERPCMDCPICLASFRDDTRSIHQLSCCHLFHKPCIRNWLEMGDNKGCPICRGPTGTKATNRHFPPLQGGRR